MGFLDIMCWVNCGYVFEEWMWFWLCWVVFGVWFVFVVGWWGCGWSLWFGGSVCRVVWCWCLCFVVVGLFFCVCWIMFERLGGGVLVGCGYGRYGIVVLYVVCVNWN